MPFESPDYPLAELMQNVGNGKIQLPDFQREWKWDDDRIAGLIASVSRGHPPSKFVSTLEKKASIDAAQLDGILASHCIDPATLRADDFEAFFDDRKRRLLDLIGLAMGKPAIIDDDNIDQELTLYEGESDDLEDLPELLDTRA